MTAREKGIKRLQVLIINTDECILYKYINRDGYGLFQFGDKGKKTKILAHRLSYELRYDVLLSKDQLVLHRCDTPACVNPKHLFLGTHEDNVRDMVNKNRQAKGRSNGRYSTGFYSRYEPVIKPLLPFERLCGRSVNLERAVEIKCAIRNRGHRSLKKLSEELHVPYQLVKDMSCGRTYRGL